LRRPIFYILAKTLQVSGILAMPWALWHGMARDDMSSELILLGLGAILFLLGRRIEKAFEG
jgi:hypothetical protein